MGAFKRTGGATSEARHALVCSADKAKRLYYFFFCLSLCSPPVLKKWEGGRAGGRKGGGKRRAGEIEPPTRSVFSPCLSGQRLISRISAEVQSLRFNQRWLLTASEAPPPTFLLPSRTPRSPPHTPQHPHPTRLSPSASRLQQSCCLERRAF